MWASGTDVHRTIRVQFNGQQDPPMLQLSGACTMTGALFTIVNAGGTMGPGQLHRHQPERGYGGAG